MGNPQLTIGMATYDDYDGVYFTVQALRLFHPEVTRQTEIVVLDNNPDGPAASSLRSMETWVEGLRYVSDQSVRGTSARGLIFREAESLNVLIVDSHVMCVPGSIRRLIDYFNSHPDSQDLLQGPLLHDDLASVSTHFAPTWGEGMYGQWETDDRGQDPDGPPFEIPMQGLGLFACRRDAWPGFNPRFSGFGAEEGYIQEKFRQAGGRALCLPFLRWVHRFERPLGVPYRNTLEDRLRNYLIGWTELGLDTDQVDDHFCERMDEEVFQAVCQSLEREYDMQC